MTNLCVLLTLITTTFPIFVYGISDKINLPANYSLESLPPTEDDSPVLLQASMNLRNILDVVETKQQIR